MDDLAQLQQDSVYALAATGTSIFAARSSGLYRSQDKGQSWQNIIDSIDEQESILTTAVTAVDKTIFAGTNGAILRSEDDGETWKLVGLASPPPLITSLVSSPDYVGDGFVVAGTAEDGVFVSTDYGQHWVPWNFGLIDLDIFCLAISPNFASDKTLFAGTETGIFYSKNAGQTWQETDFPMASAPVLSLIVTADGTLFAGTENDGLFLSKDAAQTWQAVENPLLTQEIHHVALASNQIYVLTQENLLISPDIGNTWTRHKLDISSDKLALSLLVSPSVASMIIVGFADGDILKIPY